MNIDDKIRNTGTEKEPCWEWITDLTTSVNSYNNSRLRYIQGNLNIIIFLDTKEDEVMSIKFPIEDWIPQGEIRFVSEESDEDQVMYFDEDSRLKLKLFQRFALIKLLTKTNIKEKYLNGI